MYIHMYMYTYKYVHTTHMCVLRQWVAGESYGEGIMRWPTGTQYEGEFIAGGAGAWAARGADRCLSCPEMRWKANNICIYTHINIYMDKYVYIHISYDIYIHLDVHTYMYMYDIHICCRRQGPGQLTGWGMGSAWS